jgi:2-polyprenyl-6-hydroxyphenyl methylase/3-demethylubiquinone-9 3-methyltransferase
VGKGLIKDVAWLRNPLARYRNYQVRGMSFYHDWIDWIGGYPFETASVNEVFGFYRERGFTLENLNAADGLGCSEFVFRRTTATQTSIHAKVSSKAVALKLVAKTLVDSQA